MAESRDFPFYDGRPAEISGRGWLLLLLGVALGFAALVALPLDSFPLNFVPAILFVAIPLGALAMVAGPHWTALFRRFGIKQFGQSVGFGVLTIAVSGAAGVLLNLLGPMAANPAVTSLTDIGPAELLLFLARTFIQLVGEELTTMLPLLAVLWLCVSRLGLSKRAGLVIAVVASTHGSRPCTCRPTTGTSCSASASSVRRGSC